MAPLTSLQRPSTAPHLPVDPLFPFSLLWKRSQKSRRQSQNPPQGEPQTKQAEDESNDAQSTLSKTETLCAEETIGKKKKEQS
ncbi:hypothetical protein N7478_010896 [Penicillium angulare]|uniref:uncharacterized protein n=1 Tax=Penicillium angulare TaxID=116970 RepID=UPI0025403175|nr:uncharacterized protein N7478_010896 [Penicillium angulare]KAJ5263291.1 hypothetical protein N7478_010896 [Penicillium angulare]